MKRSVRDQIAFTPELQRHKMKSLAQAEPEPKSQMKSIQREILKRITLSRMKAQNSSTRASILK